MLARQHADAAATQRHPLKKLSHALAAFATAQPQTIYLRDGEVVVYRRSRSLLYQCRYKLADGSWYRQSTRKASVEHAIAAACNLYDEARYRQRLGLAHQTHTFAQIAAITLAELRLKIDASTGRTAYTDYVSCIEKYFLPYFADKRLEELKWTPESGQL
jgi:integrase